METVESISEAEKLLVDIKTMISEQGLLFMTQREKNAQALSTLGILTPIQREIIDDLNAEDYYAGPEPDRKYPWKKIAVFGKEYRGVELYIKFSIGEANTPVVCLSFHRAEWPLKYPFKKQTL